jgi:hypothetical protein
MVLNNKKPNTINRRPISKQAVAARGATQPSKAAKSAPEQQPAKKLLTASEAAEIVKRQASDLTLKDKEIRLLKERIVRQENKLKQVKATAVHMASTSSRNASIAPRQLFDWAQTIINTVNGR